MTAAALPPTHRRQPRSFFTPFGRSLRGLLFLGPAVVLAIGLLHAGSPAGMILAAVGLVSLAAVGFLSGSRLRLDSTSVSISVLPLWRKTFAWSDVRRVSATSIHPFSPFRSGFRGGRSARRKHHAATGRDCIVRFDLFDGRHYLVGVGGNRRDVLRRLHEVCGRWRMFAEADAHDSRSVTR